ncbi:MAG: lysophospholipid acyltransferase family protein [bacterium]|nr:MAG: lysophospholipid acyltransferase family protein [bacterium]
MRHVLETAIIRTMAVLFGNMPRRMNLALGKGMGWIFYYLAYKRRRLALRNLEMAFGDEMDKDKIRSVARRSFQFLTMNVTEFFLFPRLNRDLISRYVTIEGEEHFKEALDQGKGVLTLSGHFGSWDFLSAILVLKGYDFAHISKVPRSEAVSRLWLKYRTEVGIKVFSGRGTMKMSLRHLANNGVLGMVTDQNTRRTEGVFVPFFGRPACTLPSLALLARRTGAPVIPVYSHRTANGHHVVFEAPLFQEPLSDRDHDLVERTRVFTEWTEKVVRSNPEQWIWLHDRWKTQP